MTYIFTSFPCSKSNYFIPDCIYLLLHKVLRKFNQPQKIFIRRRKKVLSVYYSFNSDFQGVLVYCFKYHRMVLPCSLFYVSQNRLTLYSLSACSFQKIRQCLCSYMKFIYIFCKYSLQCLATFSQVNISVLRDVISLKK